MQNKQKCLTFPDAKSVVSINNIIIDTHNKAAFDYLFNRTEWLMNALILVGPKSVGKTSLGLAYVNQFNGIELSLDSASLDQSLLKFDSVFIKNIHLLSHEEQEVLFHIYNYCHNNNIRLICTSEINMDDIDSFASDLSSRLKGSMVINITEPTEEVLKIIFIKILSDNQIILPDKFIDYIFARYLYIWH